MAAKKNAEPGEAQESLPTYLENDLPGFFKWFFIAIVVWGVLFSLYFLLTGYNSQQRFDAKRGQGVGWQLRETTGFTPQRLG